MNERNRVIVAIPGLGDLPGISRNVLLGDELLLDVELLLPGDNRMCCILSSRHIRNMSATVRCVDTRDAYDTLRCPPTEQAVKWEIPPDPGAPMFTDDDDVHIRASDWLQEDKQADQCKAYEEWSEL